jgi:hypothetical protein
MHLPKPLVTLLAVLILILISIAIYSLYQVEALKSTVAGASQAPQLPTPTTLTLYGSIKSVGSNSLVITTADGDVTVDLSNSTSVVDGTPISQQAYSDKIQQYDAELVQLQAQNDQAKINALVFPSGVTTQPIQFSDLTVGDSVVVICPAQSSGNTCQAQQVMKSQLPATSTPSAK